MIRLAIHGAGNLYREQAIDVLEHYAGDLSGFGVHGVEAALAIEEAISEPLRVRITGPPADPATSALRRAANQSAWGWTVVLTGSGEGEPGAEVTWRGESMVVRDPESLNDAIAKMAGEKGS
jgi:hypothetical protein